MTPNEDVEAVDPFQDPSLQARSPSVDVAAPNLTLVVGRETRLTLGIDSLVVLDDSRPQRKAWDCCGLLPSKQITPTRAIPYYNILWASLSAFDSVLTINHAHPVSSTSLRPAVISYTLEKSNRAEATQWLSVLLDRAYGLSQRQKRIKVLVNPFGGQGAAQKFFLRDIEPIFAAARCVVDVERTAYRGHAAEIAEQLDVEAYDAVACCSGDGTPHEFINGLARKPDAAYALKKVAVCQMPCGSGNAMSLNLNGTDWPSLAALAIVKGLRTPLDLVSMTQGDKRLISFLSQAFGIVAETDLGTEHMRWMGNARFTYGFLVRLFTKMVWPCDVAVSVVDGDKSSIRGKRQAHDARSDAQKISDNQRPPTAPAADALPQGLPPLRYGTITDPLPPNWQMAPYDHLGNFYSGNMSLMSKDVNFFPAAMPSDGCLDLVCIDGNISRIGAVQCLLAVGNGALFDMEHVWYRKVDGFRIVPRGWEETVKRKDGEKGEGFVAVDGERVPFMPFQVEVHQALGMSLSRNGWGFEAPGP